MESAQVVTYEDSVGEKMRVLQIGDDCITPIPGLQEALPKLMELPVKDNDILITAYPRSGTHFLWEVIRMLKNNSAEYIQGEKEAEGLELFFRNGLENKTDRVLNTHFAPECLPKDIKQGKCKIVHVYRNPKDVMVSHFNHTMNFKAFYQYGGSFSGFFEMAMAGHVETGRWFDYELKYEKFFKANPQIPVKFVAYEDMLKNPIDTMRQLSVFLGLSRDEKLFPEISKNPIDTMRQLSVFLGLSRDEKLFPEISKNPIDTMRQLSVFLGLSRDEKLFDEIAEAVSFQKMKAAKYNLKSNILKPGISLDGYSNMYRKGKSGDWKNWFTVAQNEIFDDEFNRCMEGSDLKDKIKF